MESGDVDPDGLAVELRLQSLPGHTFWGARPGQLWRSFFQSLRAGPLSKEHINICERTFMSTWDSAPSGPTLGPTFGLTLTHSCASTACTAGHCTLCANSTLRPCTQLLSAKYLVGDELKPACGADITVIFENRHCSRPASDAEVALIGNLQLQICAMPEAYWASHKHCMDWSGIAGCNTIVCRESANSHQTESVLHCKSGGFVEIDGFVTFPSRLSGPGAPLAPAQEVRSSLTLPVIDFKRSAESLLGIKTPNLVLVARAVDAATSAPLDSVVAPTASNPFTIATKRTRSAMKSPVPSMDQDVKVLHHIGDACIRKLHDIVPPASELELRLPSGCVAVRTVADMAALVAANRGDAVLEQRLFSSLLSMNEEKWEQLRGQLARAVEPDDRLRAFYAGPGIAPFPAGPLAPGEVDVGLVFGCERGNVDLSHRGARALVMRSCLDETSCLYPLSDAQATPRLLSDLHTLACESWRQPGHPGWGIFHGRDGACEDVPELGQVFYATGPRVQPAPLVAAASGVATGPSMPSHGSGTQGLAAAPQQAVADSIGGVADIAVLQSTDIFLDVAFGPDFAGLEAFDPFDTSAVHQHFSRLETLDNVEQRGVHVHAAGAHALPALAVPNGAAICARRFRYGGDGSVRLQSGPLETQRRRQEFGAARGDHAPNSGWEGQEGFAPGVSFGSFLRFDRTDPAIRSAQELERHGLTAAQPLSNCGLFFPSKDVLDSELASANRSFEMLSTAPR